MELMSGRSLKPGQMTDGAGDVLELMRDGADEDGADEWLDVVSLKPEW